MAFDQINIKKFGLHSGNRIKTLMIYLNQGDGRWLDYISQQ